jgi:thymidylate kinase
MSPFFKASSSSHRLQIDELNAGGTILWNFFKGLNDRSIEWCAVGNTRDLPNVPSNDVDIVVRQKDLFQALEYIINFAKKNKTPLIQCLRHRDGFYHVLMSKDVGRLIKLDVSANFNRGGRLFLKAEWLLEGRRPASSEGARSALIVSSPEREFEYYLLKKVDKGHASFEALTHLSCLAAEVPERVQSVLKRYWAPSVAAEILLAIKSEDPERFSQSARQWRRQMRTKLPPRQPAMVLTQFHRWISRILQPTGLFVVVLGPDGAGKSTVINGLTAEFGAAFWRKEQHHLRPYILGRARPKSAGPVTDPHAKPPYGPLKSALKTGFLLLDYVAGYWIRIRTSLVRSTLVVYDRYFQDILVDPLRYRSSAPKWFVRCLEPLVPRPDIMIVLHAAPDLIQSRKQEVSLEETSRQVKAYCGLGEEREYVRLVDASRPTDEVIHEVRRLICQFMESRMARRLRQ